MVNYNKEKNWGEDALDVDFLAEKSAREGLSEEEEKEMDFLMRLNGMRT